VHTERRSRNVIALLLGVGVLVNYFDRVNLSVAHDALQHQFGMSDIAFGYLLSSYNWTYGAMQLPSGSMLDRFGVRRVMILAILLWAVASGMAAVAPTVALLFLARFLLGVGEAPTFPAYAKAVGLWFPEHQRGVPTATFDAAAKLSIGIGTPILGLILLRYGLRANFATTAALSAVYAALFAWIYRDPVRQSKTAATQQFGVTTHGLLQLVRQRKVLGAALGSGAYNYCFYLLLTWLPVYLHRGLKMDARSAVLWTALPWLCAAAAGFGIGGLLVDRLIKQGRDPSSVRRAVLITGTALGLCVVAPAFVSDARIVLAGLSIGISGLSMASPVVWSLPALLAPRSAGRVGGIMNFSNQLAGIVAPIATGYISSLTHSFAGAFLVAAVILALGIVSYAVLLGRIEQIRAPADALV
jgi:ACS family D-galactonate transporter-like MFS transporter